ncbi:hypothetical protein C8F01DRAFT_697244 [Mycena amicta]|nr:hypothetical protein C8F01DRAFT_697244 [Mycena amicta]
MPVPSPLSPPQTFTFTTVLPPESDTQGWKSISNKWLQANTGHLKPFPVAPTDSAQSVVFEIITKPFSVVKANIIQPPRTTSTQVNPNPPTVPTTPFPTHTPGTTTSDTPAGASSLAITGTATILLTFATPSPEASSTPSVPEGGSGALGTSPNECYEAPCTTTAPPQMPSGTNDLPSGVQQGEGNHSPTAPPSSSPSSSAPKSHSSTPIIIGVVTCVGALLLAAIAFLIYRRLKRARDRRAWERTHEEIADAVRQVGGHARLSGLWRRFGGRADKNRATPPPANEQAPLFEAGRMVNDLEKQQPQNVVSTHLNASSVSVSSASASARSSLMVGD